MDFMEYRLSTFKNDIANQLGHTVFYNNVLIRVFYYLLEKRINTRILFLTTTYRRVLIPRVAAICAAAVDFPCWSYPRPSATYSLRTGPVSCI